MRRVLAAALMCFCFSLGLYGQSDEEIRKAFQDVIDSTSSPIQKKQLEDSMNIVLSVDDPEIRAQIYKAMKDAYGIVEKKNSAASKATASDTSSSSTGSTSSTGSINPKNLANPNLRESELKKIISSHVFKGDGSPENPVIINEDWEFYAVAQCFGSSDDRYDSIRLSNGEKAMPVNLNFKLGKDLDFSKNNIVWKSPFGHHDKNECSISKIIDGDGHAIKNLTAESPLFYHVSKNGIIKNLRIENSTFNMNTKYFNQVSPFSVTCEGVLINCSFSGKATGGEIYDFGNSKTGTGYAIGCVSKNSSATKGTAKNMETVACVTKNNVSAADLNSELEAWNSLFTKRKQFLCQGHFVSSGKGVSLADGAVGITSYSKSPRKKSSSPTSFTNLYGTTAGRDNYFSPRTVYYTDPGLPDDGTVLWCTNDSYINMTLSGKKNNIKGKTIKTYTLELYTKDIYGSVVKTVLDKDNAYVSEAFDDGERKGIYVRYSGGSRSVLLLTDAAVKSFGKINTDLGSLYGLSVPIKNWVETPDAGYVSRLMKSGKW